MKTIKLSKHNLDEAVAVTVEFLQEGGVAVVPTDTSYGLAADASSESAIRTLLQLKGRPEAKALSVIVSERQQAERLGMFDSNAAALWKRFMPGPLTLVVPVVDDSDLASAVIAPEQTIGLRYPDYPFSVQVAERLGRPYTSTSANRAGEPPAYSVAEFLDSLPENLLPHLVVDAGDLPIRPVSTVVRVAGSVEVLREGAISKADIMEAIAGPT